MAGFIVGSDGEKEVNKDPTLTNTEEANPITDIDDSSGGPVSAFTGNGKFCKCYGVNFNDVNGLETKISIFFLSKLGFLFVFCSSGFIFFEVFQIKTLIVNSNSKLFTNI